MPSPSKKAKGGVPRPSEIASENKRFYAQWAAKFMSDQHLIPGTLFYAESSAIHLTEPRDASRPYPSVTVMNGDAVDIAINWQCETKPDAKQEDRKDRMLVVNMANDKKAGGDWESGTIGPEECLARRSNLAQQLRTTWYTFDTTNNHYPIPPLGGLYTLNTVIFRHAADDYTPLAIPRCVPIVSVAPVRRPKLDSAGASYAFVQERQLMLGKMRTILRIAAYNGHRDLCLGAFGTGPLFKNPPKDVADMWKGLLFQDAEFRGRFRVVIFAIDARSGEDVLSVFSHAFDPYHIFYRSTIEQNHESSFASES